MGYASPDGTTQFNGALAQERAKELSTMLAKRYGLQDYNIAISSQVEPWSATTDAIEHSSLNNRTDLVRIVNSNEEPMTIDHRLKRENKAWSWLKSDVLPDMRKATVTIAYTKDQVTDKREYKPVASTPADVVIVKEFIVEDKEENICLGYSHCGPVYSSRICTRHYDYLEMFVEDIVTDKIILPSYIKRKHMNRIKNNKNIKEVVVADECSLFSMKDGDVYNKKGTILVFSNKR